MITLLHASTQEHSTTQAFLWINVTWKAGFWLYIEDESPWRGGARDDCRCGDALDAGEKTTVCIDSGGWGSRRKMRTL